MSIKNLILGAALLSLMPSPGLSLETDLKNKLQTQLNEEQTKAVLIRLKQVLKANPKDIDARVLLAKTHFELNDFPSAKKELKKAESLGADQAEWMPLLAEIYLLEGEHEKLFKYFDVSDLSQKDPSAPWIQKIKVFQGDAYLAQSKIEKARKLYESALTFNPKLLGASIGLAQSYLIEEDMPRAQKHLKKAQKVAADTTHQAEKARVMVLEAEVDRYFERKEQAEQHFKEALSLDPNNLQAHIGLVQMYLLEKNRTAFIAQAKQLHKSAPQFTLSLFYYALASLEEGQNTQAQEVLERIVRYKPKHQPSLFLLSKIYYLQNRFEAADSTLQKYLRLRPEYVPARILQASIRMKQKMPEKAIAILEPIVDQKPVAEWVSLLGQAYVLNGQLDKGIEWLEKASTLDPKNPSIGVELAASLIANQENLKAQNVLEDVASDGDFHQADLLMIFVALKNNKPEKAKQISEKLLEQDPKHPVYNNLYALSLMGLSHYREAEPYFLNAIHQAPKFLAARNNLAQLYMHLTAYRKAEKVLIHTLKEDPNNLRALLLRAHMAELQKDDAMTLKWLNTAKARNPKRPEIIPQLVRVHLKLHQNQLAYEVAQEAAQHFPGNPQIQSLLGHLALDRKAYEKAYIVFESLHQKYPKNVKVMEGLMRAQTGLNNTDEVQDLVNEILQTDTNNLSALLVGAEVALKQKDFDKVATIGQKLISHNPQSPIGYRVYGEGLLASKKTHKAVEYFEQAYDLSDEANYAKAYFRALKSNQELEKGFSILEAYLKKNPEDVEVRRFLATAYLVHKDMKKARKHFSAILKVARNDIISLNNLAHVYLHEGDVVKAQKHAQKAYEIMPNNAMVADTYAWTLIQKNDSASAIPILSKALQDNPNAHTLRYHRAVGLYEMGQIERAISELEAIQSQNLMFPDKQQAEHLLQRIKSQKG